MQAYGKTNIFKTLIYVFLTRAFQERKWSFCCQQNGIFCTKNELFEFFLQNKLCEFLSFETF
jgi:hypothetical protein